MAPTINGKNLYKRLSIRRPDSADRRDGGDASIDRRRPRRSHGRANILRGTHPSYGGISTKAHGSASNLAGRSRDGDEAAGRPRRMPSDCQHTPSSDISIAMYATTAALQRSRISGVVPGW